jgi:hypothetical protein
MKFLVRITQMASNDKSFAMVSLFPEDEKRSSCDELINVLNLQKYIFTGINHFFTQNMRLLLPHLLLTDLIENLTGLNIKFSTPIPGMIQIDAISSGEFKTLVGLDILAKQESSLLTTKMK